MRLRYAISLLAVLAMGFSTQLVTAPALEWVARGLGGTFYVLAGIFFALCLFPKLSVSNVCLAALVATVAIEFAQLWHTDWLEAMRATRPGQYLLGSTFSWADFPYYLLGYAIGLVWTAAMRPCDQRH